VALNTPMSKHIAPRMARRLTRRRKAAGTPGPSAPPAGSARRVPIFVWVLVGVAIVLCSWILVLIAVPTSRSMGKRASEASAIHSIRTIQQAELMYESTFPVQWLRLLADGFGRRPQRRRSVACRGAIAAGRSNLGLQIRLQLHHLLQGQVTTNGADRYTRPIR